MAAAAPPPVAPRHSPELPPAPVALKPLATNDIRRCAKSISNSDRFAMVHRISALFDRSCRALELSRHSLASAENATFLAPNRHAAPAFTLNWPRRAAKRRRTSCQYKEFMQSFIAIAEVAI